VEEIQVAGSLLPHPHNHPLQIVKLKEYSQQVKNDSKELLNDLLEGLKTYQAAFDELCAKQQIDVPIVSEKQLNSLNSIARLLVTLPDIPASIFNIENLEQVLNQLIEITEHGLKRDQLKNELLKDYQRSILEVNGEELLTNWNLAATKWFLPKYFQQNGIKKVLKKIYLNGKVE
jgi:hypothetical protein